MVEVGPNFLLHFGAWTVHGVVLCCRPILGDKQPAIIALLAWYFTQHSNSRANFNVYRTREKLNRNKSDHRVKYILTIFRWEIPRKAEQLEHKKP